MRYYRTAKAQEYKCTGSQPCWTCKNACGGCNWSQSGKPVAGWIAIKTYIAQNAPFEDSYKIIHCPQYKEETR